MTKKLRWGLLSTARINQRLIPELRANPEAELIAVASRSQESADIYANEWEIPQSFGSYEAMLAYTEVDVIYNPLPNHLHAEWTIKALQAGKHVLCEKPFALSVKDVDAVDAVSAETGNIATEAFMYLHHPQTKIIKQWIDEGKLGKIQAIHAVFSFPLDDQSNIRWNPDFGGGSLWDVGIYPISLAHYLLGMPVSVQGSAVFASSGVDEAFSGQLIYADGAVAHLSCSFNSPFQSRAMIVGELGRFDISWPFIRIPDHPDSLQFTNRTGDAVTIDVPQKGLYAGEIEDIHNAILRGARPAISRQTTRNHIELVEMLYRSVEK